MNSPTFKSKTYVAVDRFEAEKGGVSPIRSRMTSAASVEPLKWLFVVAFLGIAGVSNWVVIAYTHDFVPRKPLPDVVFALVPEQKWASVAGDACVGCCLLGFVLLVVLHSRRAVVLRRALFILACLYTKRSITLSVTQLPSAYTNNSERCREQVDSSFAVVVDRLLEQTIRVGFQDKQAMLCGDLLFSGHTLVMVNCALLVAYYLPRKLKFLQWLVHIPAAFGMCCMVISRTHYTIDVIIAYWLTNFVFRFNQMYHAYCEMDVYMERRRSILFSWWPCRIVDWLEENIVPGRIENELSVPFVGSLDEALNKAVVTSALHRQQQHTKQVSISSSSTLPLP